MADPRADHGDEVAVSGAEFFHRLYAVTYSKTVGLALILVMAVLVLAGTLIAQAPEGALDTKEGKAVFLEASRAKYGGWTSALEFWGLFHVFTSPLFLIVIGLLAVSIAGCTTHRIPVLWRAYRHPKIRATDRFYQGARYRGEVATALTSQETMTLAAAKLRAHHRVRLAGASELYADRFAWGAFGTVVAHASFIIILAAFAISANSGFEETLNLGAGGEPV
ncbi:MAG: cytochrome c biogenesis protein ResB, partial [Bifidobacteriaceae bacterium]|nr:cytochrome c biogenesis protein ResB [Bifidobacteriaceae bacterium]